MAKLKKCPDCAEMVQDEARKCRFCGHMFAASLPKAQPANSTEAAGGCVILAVIAFLILLVSQCGSDDASSNASSSAKKVEAPAAEPFAVKLKREVDAMKKNPRLTEVPTTKTELLLQAAVIGARMKLLAEAPEKPSKEEAKLLADFKRLETAYQRDAFPKLRKAQARVLREALWESDVEVAAVGGRSETLRFTGGIFASNRGIATAQAAIGDSLEIFRFKQARYEWYRGSESTYYDLKPLPDGALATFENNRWVPIE